MAKLFIYVDFSLAVVLFQWARVWGFSPDSSIFTPFTACWGTNTGVFWTTLKSCGQPDLQWGLVGISLYILCLKVLFAKECGKGGCVKPWFYETKVPLWSHSMSCYRQWLSIATYQDREIKSVFWQSADTRWWAVLSLRWDPHRWRKHRALWAHFANKCSSACRATGHAANFKYLSKQYHIFWQMGHHEKTFHPSPMGNLQGLLVKDFD